MISFEWRSIWKILVLLNFPDFWEKIYLKSGRTPLNLYYQIASCNSQSRNVILSSFDNILRFSLEKIDKSIKKRSTFCHERFRNRSFDNNLGDEGQDASHRQHLRKLVLRPQLLPEVSLVLMLIPEMSPLVVSH